MTDLLIVAQSAPSTQSISLLQLVIGLVSVVLAVAGVVLAVAGIAWRAGRAVATKDDLAALKTENEKAHAGITDHLIENRRQIQENRRQLHQVGESMRSIERSVAFISGRLYERDQSDEARRQGLGKAQETHG